MAAFASSVYMMQTHKSDQVVVAGVDDMTVLVYGHWSLVAGLWPIVPVGSCFCDAILDTRFSMLDDCLMNLNVE